MTHKEQNKAQTEKPSSTTDSIKPHEGHDEDCRCKEAQGKTITDFIKVMIDDLSFWKKKRK